MQKSVAVILICAAFLAGALADRVLRWASLNDLAVAGVLPPPPLPPSLPSGASPSTTGSYDASPGTGRVSTPPTGEVDRNIVDNNPDYPPTWDMKGCMTSANRRGMTAEEANHACQEVLK